MKKKTAYLGLLTAIAIIFGYVESLFPVFAAVPGMKLGLANLATVFVLYLYTWREAALVSVIRIVVIGFLFGNLFSIVFGLAGGTASLFTMALVKKNKDFSILGVSLAGGVTHNAGQILAASLVVENVKLFYYLPVLLVAGLVTGLLIGLVSREIVRRLGPVIRSHGQEDL